VKNTRYGLVIAALGLLTGLVMVFLLFEAQPLVRDKVDPYFFGAMGESVARGEGFARYGTLLSRRAPLYPLMIGGLYWLFGPNTRVVQLVQCLLLSATCWLVYDIGRRLFTPRTGFVAGIICACHPMMLRFVPDLHLETLLVCLFTLTVWATVRLHEAPTPMNGVLAGVSAGLASLTKAVVFPYPVAFAAVWFFMRLRHSKSLPWVPAACMFLALGITIVPWTIRNYRATNGKFVLISSGFSDAFLRGYVFSQLDYALLRRPPYTDAENASNAWFRAIARAAGTEWQREDYETEQVLKEAAKVKLRTEPMEFLRKFTVGLFTFWYQMTSRINSIITGGLALIVMVLAAVGVRSGMAAGRPVWMCVLPALMLNVLLAALLALGRYSAPILPPLFVLAAQGAVVLADRMFRSTSADHPRTA
jgi:4-amino-4-deoxy-L-arabinose transferase-like glycosyltransferase